MERLTNSDPIQLIEMITTFCQINDIDPNPDAAKEIINFLQIAKGGVYTETLKHALDKWTGGGLPDIKKPRILSAYFLARIIEENFKQIRDLGRSLPSSQPGEIETNGRELRKRQLYQFAEEKDWPALSAYNFLLRHPVTDNMRIENIIAEYNQFMNDRGHGA